MAPTGLSRIVRDPAPDPPSRAPNDAIEGPALAAVVRIVELQLRQVPLDTLTADALPAVLDLFEAPAGALLLYRREDAVLTLAAARGLAVAGAEALGVLRWGDEETSEMPLRALVDRKIYVVGEPAQDPFIRRLIGTDQRRPVSSVAAVPLYRWHLPVGVLLVLGGTAPLASEALLAPSFAYAVLSLALSTLMWAREERGATPLPAPDVAPSPLICVPWIDRRERAAADDRPRAMDLAERSEERSALDATLQELRGVVTRMDAERQATARERSALTDRLASFEQEHRRLAAQLAITEEDRNLLASRLASLEEVLAAKLPVGAACAASPVADAAAVASSATPAAPASPPAATTAPEPEAGPELAAPRAVLPTSGDPAQHRVLEPDPILRDHIQTALASAIPAGRGSVTVLNLAGCDGGRIAEMTAAGESGVPLVGYASHAESGSRILGPLRCFVTPPSAAEIAAAVEGAGRGNRRTILLTEDIDGFMAAKAALVKAGHSVSMACDEKQALDLLAILRPDTVVIDVRQAGQPAVEFLDALGPESGRVLTLIVHGDATGASLARIAERMMRSSALDVNELVKVCRNALPDPKRAGAAPGRR
ncbi:MAG: hypothetical protein IT293_07520 [Deltaproteobacteria bacterium]|nr:hypothetical protein [Deltaproteobacteria bacterium]